MKDTIHRQVRYVVFILLYLGLTLATTFESVVHPDLKFSAFGDKLGLFGSFDSLSFYSYVNSSLFLDSASSSGSSNNSLYIRDATNNNHLKLADLNGEIYQLYPLSNDTIIINGNFNKFNNHTVTSPIICNITNKEISSIFSSSSNETNDITTISNGEVKSILIDNELIYLGGDFEFNNTYSVAIYNITSKSLSTSVFKGFGKNSSINAITKVFSDQGDGNGSIIFGGHFNDLGLSDLLIHNTTSNSTKKHSSNSTNTSLISAEQVISLKHGTFTNINGDNNDDNSLICPSNNKEWSLVQDEGGQWAVELPDVAKGITPSKARLYIPDGSDGVKLFRIYSYPNNGIMNLSYIDPNTNEIAYCDAWCPLLTISELTNITENNRKQAENITDTSIFIDKNSGTYTSYYDPSTKTRTLGYGGNYQEFAFENYISVDKVGVTILDWYGSKGVLSGFEIYSNSIIVYGNNTLNEPNCDKETYDNFSEVNGNFQSIRSIDSSITDTDYFVSTDTDAKITLYPNITYSGNYSIIINTPGCQLDNSCDFRSILNVSVIDNDDNLLSSNLIYQNNDNNKFDYLFYGHLNGSSTHNGRNRIEISYYNTIEDTDTHWIVVDNVKASIVSLDSYYDKSSSNSTKNKTLEDNYLTYIKLNGLFEYSLANFSTFDESSVSYKSGSKTIISNKNNFVGNSSINLLSSQLNNSTFINQIILQNTSNSENMLLLGEIQSDSKNLTLSDNNLISLSINSYNITSNQTNIAITSGLIKRDDSRMTGIEGVTFNNTISKIFNYNKDLVFVGEFNMNKHNNSSVEFKDLSNSNKSISSLNNFAIYSDSEWFGFGNNFIPQDFTYFTNLTINGIEFFIFSSNSTYKVWDNSNFKWLNDQSYLLNISQVLNLNSNQQILGGSSFSIMDYYNKDQAFVGANSTFGSYNFDITNNSYGVTKSYYINETLSVIGGKFKTLSVTNVGFIDNSSKNKSITPLRGDIDWSENAFIQSLYFDSDNEHLFIGTNGSVMVNKSFNLTGIVIYDLKNNTFSDFQPADLSNDNGDAIEVNSIVLYGKNNKLLVGGNFNKAGSLDCVGLCVYDIDDTRWNNPESSSNSSVDGTVTDIKFYRTNEVLISGNLSIDGESVNFITYNFDTDTFGTKSSLNTLNSNNVITNFIINDADNNDLNGRSIAYGENFISGYDGSKWHSIDNDIEYSSTTTFKDLKLLELVNGNSKNDETFFDKDKILILSGKFELKDYGLVNVALFNGTNWIPYIYSSDPDNRIGQINSILINDSFRFSSSDDLLSKSKKLSDGKVVGISLACALGSTTLLGLLYMIPYLSLFRKQKDDNEIIHQRIQENEMMNAVNPEDLLHEIDLQRNN